MERIFTKETVDDAIGRCSRRDRTQRRPIRNKETTRLSFDFDPVFRIIRPLKGRDEKFTVVMKVGTGAAVLGEEADDIGMGPRPVTGVVKREE